MLIRVPVRAVVLAIAFGVAACSPVIQSRAVAGYTGTIRHLQVVAVAGPAYPEGEWAGLVAGLSRDLGACGIQVDVKNVRAVQAPDGVAAADMTSSAVPPDAVLRIRRVGTFYHPGAAFAGPATYRYEALVVEQPSRRALFRGQFTVRGTTFASDAAASGAKSSALLVEQLAKDGILRTCPGDH